MGASKPLFSQEGPLKAFAEDYHDRKFCLYPSTLRMLNLEGNEKLNEVANSIRKVLIYQLAIDSQQSELKTLRDAYTKKGFEEYVRVYGGAQKMLILGKGNKEYVGYAGQGRDLFAFYLKGEIRWEKIPRLVNTLQSNDLLDILSLGEKLEEVQVEIDD